MNIYRAFVKIVDRIGEGDLIDIRAGEYGGLQGLVQHIQGEWLHVVMYKDGPVSNAIV